MPAPRPIRDYALAAGVAAVLLVGGCATPPPAPAPAPDPVQPAPAEPAPQPKPAPELKPGHPTRYVVKKGDTLWDISKHFLKSPWLWPDIWYVNPQIRNPHLIYPGDVIVLRWVNGRPQLTLAPSVPTEHLQPRVRKTPIKQAIPTIPLSAIKAFLGRSSIIGEDELKTAPYLLTTSDGRPLAGKGEKVFVRGLKPGDGNDWAILRRGDPLIDPETHDVLGYEAHYIGSGVIEKRGDPATMLLTETTQGTHVGDRLVPVNDQALPTNFYPQAPAQPVNGRIIAVVGGVSEIGRRQIVVINAGTRTGVAPGSVLAIYQHNRTVEDPYTGDDVKLPDQRAGLLMVFRSFDRVSYALVMQATSEIHLLDAVRNPD